MPKPLKDITVLEVSQFLSGPICAMQLGDMGADVIKIEPKAGEFLRTWTRMVDPEYESLFCSLNRNKRGITLDLSRKEGVEIFKNLSSHADVVVENLGPGSMEGFGIGYEKLSDLNPGLVYLSISGYGRSGPHKDRTAFDLIAQGAGGTAEQVERIGKIPKIHLADIVSGIYGALGVMYALFQREKTGEGQLVDLSMQDVVYSINLGAITENLLGGERLKEIGVSYTDYPPGIKISVYGIFPTKDGEVGICAITNRQVKRLFKKMGKEELIDDERFSDLRSRFENKEKLNEIIKEWTSEREREEIVEKLSEESIPCGPIYGLSEVVEDEQLKARDMFVDINYKDMNFPVQGICPKLSEVPETIEPAPELGEHNKEILSDLGYSEEDLQELRENGVIE